MDTQKVRQSAGGIRPSGRRRQFIVNAAFQWKYTLVIVVGVFLLASAMGIMMFGYMHQQARQSNLLGRSHDAWHNTRTILVFATLFSTVTVGGLIAWGILLTHRVCGPLYVLEQHLGTLRHGQFPRYRALRQRDEFKELHASFFQTVDVLRHRAEHSRQALEDVLEALNQYASCDDIKRQAAIEKACKSVTLLRDQVAASLEPPRNQEPATLPTAQPARHPQVAGSLPA